jgi:hypothetical protein
VVGLDDADAPGRSTQRERISLFCADDRDAVAVVEVIPTRRDDAIELVAIPVRSAAAGSFTAERQTTESSDERRQTLQTVHRAGDDVTVDSGALVPPSRIFQLDRRAPAMQIKEPLSPAAQRAWIVKDMADHCDVVGRTDSKPAAHSRAQMRGCQRVGLVGGCQGDQAARVASG